MSATAPSVAIVGAGTLGLTLAQCALAAGSPVTLVVRGGPGRERMHLDRVAASVGNDVARGRITADEGARRIARLTAAGSVEDAADADVLIESVPEDLALKRRVIRAAEEAIAPTALVASTTSTIPAAWLAHDARCPERIVVAHYVWPAHRMPLVEVAMHPMTSDRAARTLHAMLAGQRKTVLEVADRPGFLLTRALFAYWDAVAELVLVDGVAPQAVDAALVRFGWPMGPAEVMQAAGLDSLARIHASVAGHLGESFPALGMLCHIVERISAMRDALADPVTVADVVAARPYRASTRAVGEHQIVERTVGALATEVDRAVADGVASSWNEAGAAVDLAYGFPHDHVGLQHWWLSQTSRLPERPLSIARP